MVETELGDSVNGTKPISKTKAKIKSPKSKNGKSSNLYNEENREINDN